MQQQQAQLEHLTATQGGVGRGRHDAGEVLEHELKRLERAREQHQIAEEQRREQHSRELATRKLQHSREHGVTTTTVLLGVQDLRDAALVLEQHATNRGTLQNQINESSSVQACHINTTAPPPSERDAGVSRGVLTSPPPESAAPTHDWHNSWGGGGGRDCAWDSSIYSRDVHEHRGTEEAEMLEESRYLSIYLFINLFILFIYLFY